MPRKQALFSSVAGAVLTAAAVFIPAASANAQELGSLSYYKLSDAEYHEHYHGWKLYLESEAREPCQHYIEPPAGFYVKDCDVYRVEVPQAAVQTTTEVTKVVETTPPPAPAPQPAPPPLLPIVSTYTIHFGFNKSNIRASEQSTLQQVSDEILKYNPTQVTVSGYTDTSGPAKYNDMLSQRRAKTVADALTARGINNQVIDKEAYGEHNLAVPTADGVKLEDNRRVVIDFRR